MFILFVKLALCLRPYEWAIHPCLLQRFFVFILFLYMFSFIIFHSYSLSNVDKNPTSLYIRGSSTNWLQLQNYAKQGKVSDELRFGSIGSVPHPSTPSIAQRATIVAYLLPYLYSSLQSFLFIASRMIWQYKPVIFPALLPKPCVAFSDWLSLIVNSLTPFPPIIPPHWFLPIYQILALMEPPLTWAPLSTPSVFLWHRLVYSCLSISYIL